MNTIKSLVIATAVLIMPVGVFAQQQRVIVDTVKTTESMGTISEMSPSTIELHSTSGAAPLSFNYTKKTTYVDTAGTPVSVETVKIGQPVTVYYTIEGDHMIADRVVLGKATTRTTVEPVVQRKRTTTTTTEIN